MDDGARRWLAKAVRKNYWRVSRWYELDDLLQEGYEVYYDVVRRYPGAVDPPHRMSLFKLAFTCRINDLANRRTRSIDEICESDMVVAGEEASEGALTRFAAPASIEASAPAFASAPAYVRDALALFATEGGLARLREVAAAEPRLGRRCRRRETLNERLCRLTGYDPKAVDIVGGIKACLAGE